MKTIKKSLFITCIALTLPHALFSATTSTPASTTPIKVTITNTTNTNFAAQVILSYQGKQVGTGTLDIGTGSGPHYGSLKSPPAAVTITTSSCYDTITLPGIKAHHLVSKKLGIITVYVQSGNPTNYKVPNQYQCNSQNYLLDSGILNIVDSNGNKTQLATQ